MYSKHASFTTICYMYCSLCLPYLLLLFHLQGSGNSPDSTSISTFRGSLTLRRLIRLYAHTVFRIRPTAILSKCCLYFLRIMQSMIILIPTSPFSLSTLYPMFFRLPYERLLCVSRCVLKPVSSISNISPYTYFLVCFLQFLNYNFISSFKS